MNKISDIYIRDINHYLSMTTNGIDNLHCSAYMIDDNVYLKVSMFSCKEQITEIDIDSIQEWSKYNTLSGLYDHLEYKIQDMLGKITGRIFEKS